MEQAQKNPDQIIRWGAVALLFVGVSSLLWTVTGILFAEDLDLWVRELASEYAEAEVPEPNPAWEWAMNVLYLVLGTIVTFGGASMLKRKRWTLALVAAILTIIPCVGPCYGCFLPLGVFVIVVLMKPDVKAAMS